MATMWPLPSCRTSTTASRATTRARSVPLLPRSFATLSQAEEENAQSRIYLGIHWQFDKQQGIATGRRVADYVFQRGLVPPGR